MTRAEGWQAAADYAESRLAASYGRVATVSHLALHPTRDLVAGVGEVRESLLAPAKGVITLFGEGEPRMLREGRLPTWSSKGTLAHVDDTGVWIGELHRAVCGSVERLAWNPGATHLLVLVADPGSEMPNLAGSGLYPNDGDDAWLPHVASTLRAALWRRLLVLDAATGELDQVGRADLNVWDACWAGDERVLCVCSDGAPDESAWFTADLRLLSVATGQDRVVASPADQVGRIAASPSGHRFAYVSAICSDRELVAGDLLLVDVDSGQTRRLAEPVDVSDVDFMDEDTVGFAGLVGMETRVGVASIDGEVAVAWASVDESAGGAGPSASFRDGRIAFVRAGFRRPPEVVLVGDGETCVLATLWPAPPAEPGTSRVHWWTAPDGLEIEGWLHLPDTEGPHPLVVVVHGGPVSSHRSSWAPTAFLRPYLVGQGYAVLMPNPRGSCGRGQQFARAVVGDMGGADAHDITSGLTSLVDSGVVDATRVGVMGGSYGGFMTAWLITQVDLFAAAVPMHPVCDWQEQHGSSNIPAWDELFLDGKPYGTGQYVERNPLTHAAAVRTPALFIAGALDRATPPGQALAMHRALASYGVPSECVTYPTAAHGARDIASLVDQAARISDWFRRWMPTTTTTAEGATTMQITGDQGDQP